jgi:hypothetical protein
MKTKLAILLRGHNFLEKDRFGYPMDSRKNMASLNTNLIKPILDLHPGSKIFFCTYDSLAVKELTEYFGPSKVILMDKNNDNQISTYKSAIKYLFNNEEFDAILATRFDLNFLKLFDTWEIEISRDTIYFPWREYSYNWNNHRRVGDSVHIIGINACHDFYNALTMCQLAKRDNLHLLFYFLRLSYPSLHFIEEGYWDSNTLFANKECSNPLYTIFNRPKLKNLANYYLMRTFF